MKKEVKYLTATSLLVLLLLLVSGRFQGYLQTIIYILSFLAPAFVCLYLYFGSNGEKKIFVSDYLKIKKNKLVLAAAFAFPTVLLVLLTSLLTAFIMSLFGKEQMTVITEAPLLAVFLHALLPAFLEETVFRYLPLRLLGKRAPAALVFLSAALFSLLHHSFFSIPHAFVAGVLFMTVDLLCDSVLPSFVIHFLNNVCSLLLMGALGVEVDVFVAFAVLGALCLFSAILLWIKKTELVEALGRAFIGGERMGIPTEIFFLAVPALLIAILELWG